MASCFLSFFLRVQLSFFTEKRLYFFLCGSRGFSPKKKGAPTEHKIGLASEKKKINGPTHVGIWKCNNCRFVYLPEGACLFESCVWLVATRHRTAVAIFLGNQPLWNGQRGKKKIRPIRKQQTRQLCQWVAQIWRKKKRQGEKNYGKKYIFLPLEPSANFISFIHSNRVFGQYFFRRENATCEASQHSELEIFPSNFVLEFSWSSGNLKIL